MENIFRKLFEKNTEAVKTVATATVLSVAAVAGSPEAHAQEHQPQHVIQNAPAEKPHKTMEGSVDLEKVAWATQAAKKEDSILEKHPFDASDVYRNPETVAKFIKESEKPFADIVGSPEKLKELDLNKAEWEVIGRNFFHVTEKNAKIAHLFDLKPSQQEEWVEGTILGYGENLAQYSHTAGPKCDDMRSMLSRMDRLASDYKARTITGEEVSGYIARLAGEFNTLTRGELTIEERNAARYFAAKLKKEFDILKLVPGDEAIGNATFSVPEREGDR